MKASRLLDQGFLEVVAGLHKPDRNGRSQRPFRAGDAVIFSNVRVHVGPWPLSSMDQVISSSDGLVRTVNDRKAKGTRTRDVLCISLLGGEEGVDDTTVLKSVR